MPRFVAVTLKVIAVLFAPIALIGFVIARQEVSGDQYVAVLEVIGSDSQPGAVGIFGADMQTLAALLNFFQAWSLPVLITIVALGIIGLTLSKDRLKATSQVCLGMFFSFGLWAALLSQGRQAFTNVIGSEISDLSSIVIAAYLSELSSKLLNLTGLLSLAFGALALVLWLVTNRRKAQASKTLN
jgi:hypothetical protein